MKKMIIKKIKDLCNKYDFPYHEFTFTKFNGKQVKKIKIEKDVKINITINEKNILMKVETDGSVSDGFHSPTALLNRLERILS